MRASRIAHPLPSGKGFRVPSKLLVALASLLVLAAAPAHAGNVTVRFGITAVTHAPTGAACPVSVPEGSDGEVVLKAAKAKGCIVSYAVTRHPVYGAFVRCVNEVCGDDTSGFFLTYWKFYEDGRPARHGISEFSARNGSEIVFAYTTWAGCLAVGGEPLC